MSAANREGLQRPSLTTAPRNSGTIWDVCSVLGKAATEYEGLRPEGSLHTESPNSMLRAFRVWCRRDEGT